jgi:hypothetical protein
MVGAMSRGIRLLITLLPMALALACPQQTSGKSPAPSGEKGPQKAEKSGPSAEAHAVNQVLARRIAELLALEKKMQTVLEGLSDAEQGASALKGRVEALAAEHGQALVDAKVRDLRSMGRIPKDPALDTWRGISGELDQKLPGLLEAFPDKPGDDATTRDLKAELAARQAEAKNLARATRVGLRAMALVSEMKGLLPRLEAELAGPAEKKDEGRKPHAPGDHQH